MTALSEKVAAEHQASLGFDDEIHCSCLNWTARFGVPDFEAHLIEATERAVRDAIVAELEAKAADLAAPRHDGEEITGFTLRLVHAEHLTNAARIAREGTTP